MITTKPTTTPPATNGPVAKGRRNAMSSTGTRVLGILALLGVLGAGTLGLSLPRTSEQHEYSRLIALHPAIAWVAYMSFGVTALCSVLWLIPRTRNRKWDLLAGASAEIAVVFTALTLVTGAIWGRPTWGVYWVWDARLTLSALMLALFLGYLALRKSVEDADARAKLCSITALVMVLIIPVNNRAVVWWRTLHQGESIVKADETLGTPFVMAMLLSFVSFTMLYAWLLWHRYRIELAQEWLEDQGYDLALAERRAEGVGSKGPGAAAGLGAA